MVLRKVKKSGLGVLKAALTVEGQQMRLEIDVHPLDATLARNCYGMLDQRLANSAPLPPSMHRGVENECMHAAIPSKINKADQLVAVVRAHVGQTVRQHRLEIRRNVVWPCRSEQRVKIIVGGVRANAVGDRLLIQ